MDGITAVAEQETPAMPNDPGIRHVKRWPWLIAVVVGFVAAAGLIGSQTGSSQNPVVNHGQFKTATPPRSDTSRADAGLNAVGRTDASAPQSSPSASGVPAGQAPAAPGSAAPKNNDAAAAASSGLRLDANTKVVQSGSIALQVPAAQVIGVTDKAAALGTANGGYVQERHSDGGAEHPSGSVTLRVPNTNFDATLNSARALGKVATTQVAAKDVTADYVDVQARLDALNRTRAQFDTILAKASNIGDILSVQDRINTLQVQIEQLQGQQKVLDDQTTFATLTVTVGDDATVPKPVKQHTGLTKAWHDAGRGFTSAVQRVVAGSGLAAFWLVVLAMATAIAVGLRRVLRRRGNDPVAVQ